MEISIIPGYSDLFEGDLPSYEELVRDIPSEAIIIFAIVINSELQLLTAQQAHFNFLSKMLNALPPSLTKDLRSVIQKFRDVTFFGERYLMELIVRELKRGKISDIEITSQQEFSILRAYFLVVDELNGKTNALIAPKWEDESYNEELELLWLPLVNQFEHNYFPQPIQEYFKLLCFIRYAKDKYDPYLRKLISDYNLRSIGEFIGASHILYNASNAISDNEDLMFRANTMINVSKETDNSHIESLTINNLDPQTISISSLKTHPLYRDSNEHYRVINRTYLLKRTYRGPFFDLYDKTDLKNNKNLVKDKTNYISEIAKDVLEIICFRETINLIIKSKHDCIRFDENDDDNGFPDLYYRGQDNKVMLVEFKAYLFPEAIPKDPNKQAILKYINDRFVKDGSKKKGVLQLCSNIKSMLSGKYDFDHKINKCVYKNNIHIYPILCHNDFNFSIPGLAQYLNRIMTEELSEINKTKVIIHDLVLLSLDNFINFFLYDKKMTDVFNIINSYEAYVTKMAERYHASRNPNDFLTSKISLDGYILQKGIFTSKMNDVENKRNSIISATGLTQELLEETY